MRVVFFGNHTVGVETLTAISETEAVAAVVAHPPDPEDGIRYLSVCDFATRRGWNVIRSTGKDPTLEGFVAAAEPDLLWIADYRYLLPPSILNLAPFGAVNLHPSLLPRYRGRASINWAILNNEKTLGLTAHYVDEGMDTGDIIAQLSYELRQDQDVGDALDTLYPLYSELTAKVLGYFGSGSVPRAPQDHSQATTFPGRKPEDGLIDFRESASSVHNLIRALTRPYPGAFTFWQHHKLMVLHSRLTDCAQHTDKRPPGTIVAIERAGPMVQCGGSVIQLTEIEWADQPRSALSPGHVLGC